MERAARASAAYDRPAPRPLESTAGLRPRRRLSLGPARPRPIPSARPSRQLPGVRPDDRRRGSLRDPSAALTTAPPDLLRLGPTQTYRRRRATRAASAAPPATPSTPSTGNESRSVKPSSLVAGTAPADALFAAGDVERCCAGDELGLGLRLGPSVPDVAVTVARAVAANALACGRSCERTNGYRASPGHSVSDMSR